MMRVVLSVLLSIMVLKTTKVTSLPSAVNVSQPKCTNSITKVVCNGTIPTSVPDTVQELVLVQIDSREFYPGKFCHVSWTNVTLLIFEFVTVADNANSRFNLDNHVFKCLQNITTFKFSSEFLRGFQNHTFSDLTNVIRFDLSQCRNLMWNYLYETLSVRSNLPKLTTLRLSGTGIYTQLDLNKTFISSLSYRRIIYLDLSFSFFRFNFKNPGELCKSLKVLRYPGARFTLSKKFNKCDVCDSLEVVDNSADIHLRNIFHHSSCINEVEHFEPFSPFFRKMRVLYVNSIVTPLEKYKVSNCSWVLWNTTYVKEFYFSYNYLPNFDIRLISSRIQHIDLSNDHIETVNKEAFREVSSLETVDLSNNKLFKANAFGATFSALFRHNRLLKVIDLSYNKLKWLPEGMFGLNTNLTNLDLSHNLFQQITFNISNLLCLTVLDLRFNLIQSFDGSSRKRLETLYERQKQHNVTNNKNAIHVLLTGNPFSCSCSSLDFIKWFAMSPIFSTTRSEYHCKLDGKSIVMSDAAINASMEDCRKAKRRRLIVVLSSTLPTIVVLATVVVLVILYKRRKRKLFHQHFENRIRRLRDNSNHFPVLLSYSSQDNEFVDQHVLQQLQVNFFIA